MTEVICPLRPRKLRLLLVHVRDGRSDADQTKSFAMVEEAFDAPSDLRSLGNYHDLSYRFEIAGVVAHF